jgi:CHAD domain-containing protein
VRTLFNLLPRAVAGDEESVHQMRVVGRRTRVALPLLARNPTGRRVRGARRRLRSLIRTAASSRDLDVSLALWRELVPAGPRAAAEGQVLERRLVAARRRSRQRLKQALLDQDLARLRRDLRVVVSRRGEEPGIVLARLEAARDAGGAELLALVRDLGDRFDPEGLHHLRTRVRRLRYVAEVDAELRETPARAAKRLKTLQEELGAIHDAWVLAAWLGRQAAAADRRGGTALAAEGRRLEDVALGASRARHGHYLALGPAALVDQALASLGEAGPRPLRLAQ